MDKKILTVVALVLVAVTAVFMCTSCAKKEEAKVTINVKVVNQTSEAIKTIRLEETIGKKDSWSAGSVPANGEAAISINTATENGAPNVVATITTQSGLVYQTVINTKGDKTITVKADINGGIVTEVTEK